MTGNTWCHVEVTNTFLRILRKNPLFLQYFETLEGKKESEIMYTYLGSQHIAGADPGFDRGGPRS